MASRDRKKITIPLFPELKEEPFTDYKAEIPTEDEVKKRRREVRKYALKKIAERELEEKVKAEAEKYDLEPSDKYMCKACNIYLLYKNVNRHNETKTHIVNKKQ
jgi:hypothetical protein